MSMKMKLKQIKIWNTIERLSPDPIGCNYLIFSEKADSRADRCKEDKTERSGPEQRTGEVDKISMKAPLKDEASEVRR